MRRDPMPWLLLLLLTFLGSLAYLTRNPEHPVLDRLAGWPGIGSAAERFRDLYRPAPVRPVEEGPQPEVIVIGRRDADAFAEPVPARPLGSVWVRAGTELREAPDAESAVAGTVPRVGTMTLLERRGDWRRLSRVGLQGSPLEGWVRSDELDELSVEELWEPEPVVALAAAVPREEVLAEARGFMGDDARQLPCGPFLLVTDVEGPPVESCARLAGQLDPVYAERTGLVPVGEPAGAILLFDREGAYLVFRTRVSPGSRRQAWASPAGGFVAVAGGDRSVAQVQAMLVHELVHLLNRRFLGPALPAWLDEGLAEELGMSRIAADGTLAAGSLGRFESGAGSRRLVGGGEIHLDALRDSMRRGDLPTLEGLVGLDRADFQAEERFQVNYGVSAFWVRYLLSDAAPAGGAGFRSFLAAVAGGETLDEELLLGRLGVGWPELESGFRRWLDAGAGVS